MLKIAGGVFLAVHGLVHLLYFAPADDPAYPMTAAKSWLVARAGVRLETVAPVVAVLAIAATVGFCLLALSHWGLVVPTGWLRPLAAFSVTASMLLMAVTWNYQFVVGVAIDVAVLYWAFVWQAR